MMKIMRVGFTSLVLLFCTYTFSQNVSKDTFGKGITVSAEDSSFYMKFGLRFQLLYLGEKNLETDNYQERMMTKRARLKFDGFVFDPSLKFKVQFALSNKDDNGGHIPESGNTANIVLDAVLKWDLGNNWTLWFGQAKLPSSREFTISSQNLEFVDRSAVHANFNVNRDRGIQLHHKSGTDFVIKQAFSLTLGEGRNIIVNNPVNGYQVSGRLEFLPFGAFTKGGDYYMADLQREPTPKLSIGVAGNSNSNAVRERGNHGAFIVDTDSNYVTNDLRSVFVDLMFKYKGVSLFTEYSNRSTKQRNNGFATGNGLVAQVGYLLPSNWGFSIRLSEVNGNNSSSINHLAEFTFGASRYIVGHHLKVQSDLSYQNIPSGDNALIFRFQTELTF